MMEKHIQMIPGSLAFATTLLSVNLDSLEIESRLDLWAQVVVDGVMNDKCYLLSFKISGSGHYGWTVSDEDYSSMLPYLKPVDTFREFLISEMKREGDKLSESVHYKKRDASLEVSATLAAFGSYSLALANFDQTRALLGQVKRLVENMMQQCKGGFSRELKVDPLLLKRALEVLGEVPCTDQQFSVADK